MENAELQLFNFKLTDLELRNRISTSLPLNEEIKPKIARTELPNTSMKSIETALGAIFPTHQEENKLQFARQILGNTVEGIGDEELQIFLTEMQYLLDSWFDFYEKQIFEGLTLKQILRGDKK